MTARDSVARGGLAAARGTRWTGRLLRGEFVKRVGGPARARVIALFGAVLALNGADTATVGAIAPQLEHALHIGNTKIGLLSSAALLVGAVFTIPVGLLVDRIKRIPMLSLSIVLWSVASLLSAFAGSYSGLLLTRLAARRGDRDRRPGDRVADRRLLPGARARPGLRLHPGRGDRRDRVRVHHQQQRRQPDRLAGRVRAAGAPRVLPGPRAVPDRPRAAAGRPEPARAGVEDLERGGGASPPRSCRPTRPRPTSRRRQTTSPIEAASAAREPSQTRSSCSTRTLASWA